MSELKIDAIILHTDGSCVPNPGQGGWGFHGYTYSKEPPKKGSGNPDYYITDKGYVEKFMLDAFRKKEAGDEDINPYDHLEGMTLKNGTYDILDEHMASVEVTPIQYLDFFGPMGQTSNNASEGTALLKALEYCLKEQIHTIQILADSEYVLAGWNKALPIWQKNNWYRRDGAEIKNKEMWKALWELKLAMKDFSIEATWVPGHSIFLGNQIADMNANLGKNMTVAGLTEPIMSVSPASGYWKQADVDKHPLIVHHKLFFNGEYEHHVPGYYYMGSTDKDIGLTGKRLSDTAYSVIKLKEPIESLEALVKHQCEQGEDTNELVIAHLSTFFKSTVYKQFTEFGKFSIYAPDDYINSMVSSDRKQVVTEVVFPPKRSMDAVIAMNNIAERLEDWLEKRPGARRFVETDITPHLYETSVVKKKNKDVIVSKLKASIKPGVASVEVDAKYKDSTGTELSLPTILSFGIDMADRNGLKRIEELCPIVTLLTWEESPGVFRYFTVIQAGDDVGAYCGFYSNLRLNKAKKKTTVS